jgi:hypothetical protein
MICIGGSHMVCVLEAAEEAGSPLQAIGLKARAFMDVANEPEILESDTLDRKTVNKHGGPVFSFVGGIRYLSLGVARHPTPYDFILPAAPELPLDPGAELLPYRALREKLEHDDGRHLETLERIAEVADGPVYQFESPPPPPQAWLEKRSAEKTSRDRTHELPAPYVRYKLWRVYSELVQEVADRVGARFIPHPSEAVDGEGFLKEGLSKNPTHANSRYGALVLGQLRSLADGRP